MIRTIIFWSQHDFHRIARPSISFSVKKSPWRESNLRRRSFAAQQRNLTSFPLIKIDTVLPSALVQYKYIFLLPTLVVHARRLLYKWLQLEMTRPVFFCGHAVLVNILSFQRKNSGVFAAETWAICLDEKQQNETKRKKMRLPDVECRMGGDAEDIGIHFALYSCDNWIRLCGWHLFFVVQMNEKSALLAIVDRMPQWKKKNRMKCCFRVHAFIAHTSSAAVHHLAWKTHFDLIQWSGAQAPNIIPLFHVKLLKTYNQNCETMPLWPEWTEYDGGGGSVFHLFLFIRGTRYR